MAVAGWQLLTRCRQTERWLAVRTELNELGTKIQDNIYCRDTLKAEKYDKVPYILVGSSELTICRLNFLNAHTNYHQLPQE